MVNPVVVDDLDSMVVVGLDSVVMVMVEEREVEERGRENIEKHSGFMCYI
ncbi:hypothetical protein Hanom_Chr17g01577851 [Helianthus anomalus]